MSNQYADYWNRLAHANGPTNAVTGLGDAYRATVLPVMQKCAPKKVTAVVDLGCGAGLCYPLVKELWPKAAYAGYDISYEMIRYCIETYADKDPITPLMAARLRLPDPPPVLWQTIDGPNFSTHAESIYLICHSVFTHIYPEDAHAYLAEIRTCLGTTGQASISVHIDCGTDWKGDIGRIDYEPSYWENMLMSAGLETLFTIEGNQRVYCVRAK